MLLATKFSTYTYDYSTLHFLGQRQQLPKQRFAYDMIRLKGDLARLLKPLTTTTTTILRQSQSRSNMSSSSPKNPIHFGPYEVTKQVCSYPPTLALTLTVPLNGDQKHNPNPST